MRYNIVEMTGASQVYISHIRRYVYKEKIRFHCIRIQQSQPDKFGMSRMISGLVTTLSFSINYINGPE
ncbi:hypothetical protein J6590_007441 [Homalodisca vitripennis]|nr:hypothetical protein J6590_007441 [Homalodisca vitripennis]